MTITKITVSAGRTFNHPHEEYSNLRPEVVLEATVSEGESAREATRALQAQAEQLVEDHKLGLLRSIESLWKLTQRRAEMVGLQRELERSQARLDEIRLENPELQLGEGDPLA